MLLPSKSSLTLILASLIQLAQSHSIQPPPLHPRALSHPSHVSHTLISRSSPSPPQSNKKNKRRNSIEEKEGLGRSLLPTAQQDSREPLWNDRFLLSFRGHDDQEVTMSLKPSESLVHPKGIRSRERHFNQLLGEWETREDVITREKVRVYEGWVMRDGEDLERWIEEEKVGIVRQGDRWREFAKGWARITLTEDKDNEEEGLRFQGAYMMDGETFTIHPTTRYLKTKHELDPELRSLQKRDQKVDRRMVIVRERDILTDVEKIEVIRKRGLGQLPDPYALLNESTSSSCSHDSLPFNTDPHNPILQTALDQSIFSSFHSPWVPFLGLPSPSSPFTSTDHSSSSSPSTHSRFRRQSSDDIPGGSGTSSNFINSIGSTQGCPKSAMVVFIGVAADCTYTESYSGSTDTARLQILDDINRVSALYLQSFNISIGIVELAVMGASCPSSSTNIDQQNPWNLPCPSDAPVGGSVSTASFGIDLNSRLSVFSQWRGDKGGGDSAGLWHLMTACQSGSEVGVAWLGQLCRVQASSQGGQTTSGTGVTAITRNEWQVVAHEIGHNFGAIHDCREGCSLSGSCCPLSTSSCDAGANYIMSPVSQQEVTQFSPCSIGNICSAIGSSLNTTCIVDQGASGNPRIISEQSCGNGIVEEGEECDPGSASSSCCDASTCRFVSGAVCDPLNSLCCTTQCQVAGSGTVCRASIDQRCDKEEVCDGSSSSCPDDSYESNGTGCGDGLTCASGVCTSRDLQCRNAGASIGITGACPTSTNTGCSITCDDPTRSSGCVILDQSFRDGTSCGFGGRCENGECASGNALDTAKSWYTQNLRISIPVTIVVGIIVLLILYGIIRCCCCGGRRTRGFAGQRPAKNQAYSSNYAAPPPQMSGYGGPPPMNMNNNGYYAPPPGVPPPVHHSRLRR